MIAVGRYINGIMLNPLEWLEKEDGSLATFPDEESAKEYLREYYTEEEIYYMVFEEVEDEQT